MAVDGTRSGLSGLHTGTRKEADHRISLPQDRLFSPHPTGFSWTSSTGFSDESDRLLGPWLHPRQPQRHEVHMDDAVLRKALPTNRLFGACRFGAVDLRQSLDASATWSGSGSPDRS